MKSCLRFLSFIGTLGISAILFCNTAASARGAHQFQPINDFDFIGLGHFEGVYDGQLWFKFYQNAGERIVVQASLLDQSNHLFLAGLYLYAPVGDNTADIGDSWNNDRLGLVTLDEITASRPATVSPGPNSGEYAALFSHEENVPPGGLRYRIAVINVPEPKTSALFAFGIGVLTVRYICKYRENS